MRLIDADKLINDIKDGSVKGMSDYTAMWSVAGIKAVINAQPTVEAEPKWIAVEERLPEEWERVLAMIYIDKLPERPIIDTMRFIGNIDGHNKWLVCWNADMVESDVTHWMPLPGYHPDYDTKIDEKENEG